MDGKKVERNPIAEELVRGFLSEDLGYGDITSDALIRREQRAEARLFFREPGVAAGLEEAAAIFTLLGCDVKQRALDGASVEAKKHLLEIEGPARALLAGERVALNIVSHMSGIATATATTVRSARSANPKTRVAATRKTHPGLRNLEKKAVELGGGDTHRLRLDDCVLIKDNHLELLPSVTEAIRLARERVSFTKKIEVEVRDYAQAEEAALAGADIIMLDNMNPSKIREVLAALRSKGLCEGRLFEASGGITPENAAEYASSGVDVVSLGSLTHSVKALDVKLEIRMNRGMNA
ncbi:MAG: carboxylating nicotinate-nucleotide diphosphorylase [Candidatus Bathyarchaeota archaeon]|nr:carboxylating nicotinate-nucleotide diphosphorylase [Candidatus Bathyarchaeota archaeon]